MTHRTHRPARLAAILLCLWLAAAPVAGAQPCSTPRLTAPDRPVVGLVLSGGGARGAAHVGVLRVIEELGIPVDLVVGTSMGSIVGALYASGMPVDDLDRLVSETDWTTVLDDAPPRASLALRRKAEDRAFSGGGRLGIGPEGLRLPAGAREGQNVRLLLRDLTRHVQDVACFADLPLPFAAVATDAETGLPVTLAGGDLVEALRASMAIPGYFSPVALDGRLLVDGGVANNMPVSLAREMGAQVVIAVDIASPLQQRGELRNLFAVSLQMTTILAQRAAEAERRTLGSGDVLVTPDLAGIETLDFPRMALAVRAGEAAARAALAGSPLRGAGSVPPSVRNAQRWEASRQPVNVRSIRIEDPGTVPPRQLADRLDIATGDNVSGTALRNAIGRVYGLDYFSVVDYRLDEAGNLAVVPQAREWGPNYLQFGLNLYNNFQGIDSHTLGGSFTATQLNRLSGQFYSQLLLGDTLRLHAELYQPTSQRADLFVAPWVTLERASLDYYSGSTLVARLRSGREEAGLDLGLALRHDEWRVGIGHGTRRLEPLVFVLPLPASTADVGYLRLSGFHDTFDHRDFPASGSLLRLHAERGRRALGADDDYDIVTLAADRAASVGRWSLEAGTTLRSQRHGAAIDLAPQQLGGVLAMSAFSPGELGGDHAATVRALARRPLNEVPWLRLHGGIALEYGGAWNGDFHDAPASGLWPVLTGFVALATPLGPLWLVGGVSEEQRRALHLQLGSRF